ncbi:MAG TPA: gluconate 2-dehydrogenase subunit 3 family protein [Gemmatimonadales bacterium]|nr:gluconate 2-dehydrogenase subunit 3 family protein [Gemmatimonadales bacterium]
MESVSSRRDFLARIGGLWMAANLPLVLSLGARAREAAARGGAFSTFAESEARAFEAVAAQILPSGGLPGAREAGAVYFADGALGTFFADQLPDMRLGLAELDQRARSMGGAAFAGLDDEHQKTLLHELEPTALFQGIWMLTMMGVFAEPSYGGNREDAAQQLLGITRAPTYQPPFGYYDAGKGAED